MKTKHLFLAVLFYSFTATMLSAQNCSPADITLNSQAAIDDFQSTYGTCTTITGNLTIEGNDIVNLDGLQNITSIGGAPKTRQ
jgi:hypothetical protein